MCCCTLDRMDTHYLRVPDWQSEGSSAITTLHSKCSIKVLCIWLECPLSSLWDKVYSVPEALPLYKVWSNWVFWDGAHSLQGRSKCLHSWWDQLEVVRDFSGWVAMWKRDRNSFSSSWWCSVKSVQQPRTGLWVLTCLQECLLKACSEYLECTFLFSELLESWVLPLHRFLVGGTC